MRAAAPAVPPAPDATPCPPVTVVAAVTAKKEFMDVVPTSLVSMPAKPRVMRVLPRLNENINEEWIDDKTRFVFWEIWESKEALEQHNQQPYIQAFLELAEEKLQAAPEVFLLDKI